jgi:DNA replication protein DnaC
VAARGSRTADTYYWRRSEEARKRSNKCREVSREPWLRTRCIRRAETEQKRRIRSALLCHNPDASPLANVNLLELKGNSSVNLTTSFNPAQKDAYNLLAHTPEITLIYGPFSTGKTTLNITHALKVISNLATKNKVLYLVESNNVAIDNIVLHI